MRGGLFLQLGELLFEVDDILKEIAVFVLGVPNALLQSVLSIAKLVIFAGECVTVLTLSIVKLVEFVVKPFVLGLECLDAIDQLGD